MEHSVFDRQHQIGSIESKIVVALERISEAFRVLLWQQGKAHSLSPLQVQIVVFCSFHHPAQCRVGRLAMEFNLTKATISDAVRALEKKGHIEKHPEPDDTRSYTIHLTPGGRSLAARVALFANQLIVPLSGLGETQKEGMLAGLLELIRQLQEAGIISLNRMCFTCRFYRNTDTGHYCNLIKSALQEKELRIDCPEHEPV